MMSMIKTACVLIGSVGMLTGISFVDTYYKMDANVKYVNEDKVIVIDKVGKEWEFLGDGFNVNDKVKVVFDSNHSSSRYDDRVVDCWVVE